MGADTITLNGREFKEVNGQARRNDASHPSPASPPKKRNKYGARSVVVDGMKFDSQRELKRWRELLALHGNYKIAHLERQVVYELAPAVYLHGERRKKPALRYVADFRYLDGNQIIVEDSKGRDTPVSRIKRHLMKSVHGIDVVLS